MNLSRDGMLIKSREICFPFEQDIEVSVSIRGEILRIRSRMVRIMLSPAFKDDFAIRFSNPIKNYLELIPARENIAAANMLS
jgi:hypothetical protein